MLVTRPSAQTPLPWLSLLRSSWQQWLVTGTPAAGPVWPQVLWTTLFSAMLAVAFTLLGFALNAGTLAQWFDWHAWLLWYERNLVVSLVIGFTIQGLFAVARLLLGKKRLGSFTGWKRLAWFGGLPLAGVAIGWPVGMALIYGGVDVLLRLRATDLLSMAVLSVMVCALIGLYYNLRFRQLRAEMRATDAQLRLLQGQMEPHFLFNTLATVVSLIDADAPRARQMLEAFTDYLRASLGSLRRDDSTLNQELDLAIRYLSLMQARMGDRLRVRVDVPAALGATPLPPLLLQPLVENAVKHGLEPCVDGGVVHVSARALASGGVPTLELCVDDDGAGLDAARQRGTAAGRGNGVALANLRARLLSLYGPTASLHLEPGAQGRGTRARLLLPCIAPTRPAPEETDRS